jgi:NAD(P)-dependent dehydrogenase (short-subunit alcohol dehydrogenase family)
MFTREIGVRQFGRQEAQWRDEVRLAQPLERLGAPMEFARASAGVARVWPEKWMRASEIYSIESWLV